MNDKILHISNTEFDVNTIYPNSVLLTSCDQPRQGNEYHTSIGDMPAGDIMKIVSEFDTINFLDQSFSSESDLWKETVVLLTALSHQHKVCNFNPGKVKNFLEKSCNCKLNCDGAQIQLWPVNSFSELHIHNCFGREGGDYNSLLYLNDDFDGGEFITNDLSIKPEQGMLTFFDGSKTYHGLREVKNKHRYTLIFWWSNTIFYEL
jgi:hypothetical protein